MCGIFGMVSKETIARRDIKFLAKHARQRGRDSSGLVGYRGDRYHVEKANDDILSLFKRFDTKQCSIVLGHSRLITNGLHDNQPVLKHGVCVLHNGIIVNENEIWTKLQKAPELSVDTEVLNAISADSLENQLDFEKLSKVILDLCKGTVSCALLLPSYGKLCLFSNNGSLYLGRRGPQYLFSSEMYPLERQNCDEINQVKDDGVVLDVPKGEIVEKINKSTRVQNLLPSISTNSQEERLLNYKDHTLQRCSKCILPETMPFIRFNEKGVCNYCINYQSRNKPKPKHEIFELVEPYRRKIGQECILPFSGGRDSCYGLHLVVKELGLRPVAYTYDWGMVTDLGRRNISRMCGDLGVENIIVADDIIKKRLNIKLNLQSWLKSPNLGMVSILTAGDKHFFRHVETIKKQTGINLNLWGVNPLEVTHFKAGFLGLAPDFDEKRVYTSDLYNQMEYQFLRLQAMAKSLGYFNRSLWDTLSGEYYRSFMKKSDYFHIFDYWRWDENVVNHTLSKYDWELAPDTSTTWRIGDGTAGFYNYIYYSLAGFTEHDTFRSNQVREGQLSRDKAIELVRNENRPRYQNIRWYLDAIGMDFVEVVTRINEFAPPRQTQM